MRFKIDENLPVEAATVLRNAGFDTHTVWDEELSGTDDQSLAIRVRNEGRVLVTLDLDFANVQAYPPNRYSGIIVLRLKTQDKTNVLAYMRRALAALGLRNPVGELWIVQHDRVRIRRDD